MDKAVQDNIARRIRQAREAIGMTQEELARHLSVDRVTVTRYENSVRCPHASDLPKLAQILQVSILFFFENEQTAL